MKNLEINTIVVHSKSKHQWYVIGKTLGKKHKIAVLPYLDFEYEKQQAYEHAEFISYCFNNAKSIITNK